MKIPKSKKKNENIPVKDDIQIDLNNDININIAEVKSILGNSSDLTVDICTPDNSAGLEYAIIYIDSISNKDFIDNLSEELAKVIKVKDKHDSISHDIYLKTFINYFSSFPRSEEGSDFNSLINSLLIGYTIVLAGGYNKFFSINNYFIEGRAVVEPTSQNIIRGPKEGFTERLSINIGLLRKKIRNKALRIEDLYTGNVTNTKVVMMYIDGIAKEEIVQEIKRRLSIIDIDCILDSSYIEELIKDDRYSIFPTFLNSEKPDSVTAALLEGRVAILVDGTPFVLTAPALFVEFLQASEDYYHNFFVSSMSRLIRFSAFFLTLLVPSVYIALITFHQEMIPTQLLISIASQRDAVPFPALIEALLMEVTFEILREAGVRMPRVIGPAISIVGALVLGQAAVNAGIISAAMVIIVSITAISSFAIPNYTLSNAVRVLRFGLMFLAGIFGLYGIFMGLIVIVLHLSKLKSIGLPYLSPIAPKIKGGNKDTILRSPLWKTRFRPVIISEDSAPRVNMDNPVSKKGEREFK